MNNKLKRYVSTIKDIDLNEQLKKKALFVKAHITRVDFIKSLNRYIASLIEKGDLDKEHKSRFYSDAMRDYDKDKVGVALW